MYITFVNKYNISTKCHIGNYLYCLLKSKNGAQYIFSLFLFNPFPSIRPCCAQAYVNLVAHAWRTEPKIE